MMSDWEMTGENIFQEMMSHPVIFSHPEPRVVAIMDDNVGIIREVLKHTQLTEIWVAKTETPLQQKDQRIKIITTAPTLPQQSFDIVIDVQGIALQSFSEYFNVLNPEGILMLAGESPFQLDSLKILQQHFVSAGFSDLIILNFPHPKYHSGWRTAIMAKKQGVFPRLREKDIFNKTFATHYYNFDTHKASLALPEFMRVHS